jgi:hypothetical protein
VLAEITESKTSNINNNDETAEHLARMESPGNTSKQKGWQIRNGTECEINLGIQEAVGFYTPMIRKA